MLNVLVTGGSRGLGLAIARVLAAAGYRAIAIARGESPALNAACEEARTEGRGAIEFRSCDLSETGQISPLVRAIRADFGPIYGLVNNAGLGTAGMLGVMRDKDIESLIRLNTLSPIMLTKYVARSMMIERQGRIVNVSSIVASTGYSGLSVYSATKASLIGFTRSLSREVGRLGVNVNAIAPGYFATANTELLQADEVRSREILNRIPAGRWGQPRDLAGAAVFLASAASDYVTGTVLTVDGGWMAR